MTVSQSSAPPDRRWCRKCQRRNPKNPPRPDWQPQLLECRCGQVFEQSQSNQRYCRPNCRPSWNGAPKRNTTERGYGHEHRKAVRAAWAAFVPGDLCSRCQKPMWPGDELHLDHDDRDRTRYRGLAHARCNVSAGAIRGNRMRRAFWQRRATQLALFKPSELRPHCACGAERRPDSEQCRSCEVTAKSATRHAEREQREGERLLLALERENDRQTLYAAVEWLLAQGETHRYIAGLLGVGQRTVTRVNLRDPVTGVVPR